MVPSRQSHRTVFVTVIISSMVIVEATVMVTAVAMVVAEVLVSVILLIYFPCCIYGAAQF